jgi:hypothetical protein
MRYFIGQNGNRLGPFSGAEVRARLDSGEIHFEDLVWREGLSAWVPVRAEFPPLHAPPLPPPGLASVPALSASPAAVAPDSASSATPPFAPGSGFRAEVPATVAPAADSDAPVPGATKGMVLGIIGMVTWLFPLLGLPISIWGLVVSIKAKSAGGGGKAIAGLVLSGIAIALSLLNAVLGAVLAVAKHLSEGG